jgi:hypothetical protein
MIKKEQFDILIAKLKKGLNLKDSALMAGISRQTVYDWKEINPEYWDAVKKAEVEFKTSLVDTVKAASIKNWTAAAWILERKYFDEYGRKEYSKHEITADESLIEMIRKQSKAAEPVKPNPDIEAPEGKE